jgi:hypothetical protein
MPESISDDSPIRYVDPDTVNTAAGSRNRKHRGRAENTVEKLTEQLGKFDDEELTKRLVEVESGHSLIVFEEMDEGTEGQTVINNGKVTYKLNKKYEKATNEADLWRASIILGHELQRNPETGDLRGETAEIVLRDVGFIEKLAAEYGEKVYKTNPEFAVLRYVRKRFGEEGLKKFADTVFNHKRSYYDWEWDDQFWEDFHNGELSPTDVFEDSFNRAAQEFVHIFNMNLVTGPKFSDMNADSQYNYLLNLYNEAKTKGGSYKGGIAAYMRNDLRDNMKLTGLFAIDEIFMNGRFREFLNVNENGEDYYTLNNMKLTFGWFKVPSYGSHYHQSYAPRTTKRLTVSNDGFTVYKVVYTRLNAKFMNFDGREAIFKWPDIYVNDGPDRGTYNYVNGIDQDGHNKFDVYLFEKYSPAGYNKNTLILHNRHYSLIKGNRYYWRF